MQKVCTYAYVHVYGVSLSLSLSPLFLCSLSAPPPPVLFLFLFFFLFLFLFLFFFLFLFLFLFGSDTGVAACYNSLMSYVLQTYVRTYLIIYVRTYTNHRNEWFANRRCRDLHPWQGCSYKWTALTNGLLLQMDCRTNGLLLQNDCSAPPTLPPFIPPPPRLPLAPSHHPSSTESLCISLGTRAT